MTRVLVVGYTARTRHFLRYALGQQTIEVAGLVTAVPGDQVGYAFVADSAPTPFRGTAACDGDTLVLAGRHGRGGLRHDRIPLFQDVPSALAALADLDAVLLAEDWAADLPPELDDGRVLVRLAPPDGAASATALAGQPVPDPIADLVQGIVGAIDALTPVQHVFVSTVGGVNPGASARDRSLAMRGARAGRAVVTQATETLLALNVVDAEAARVCITSLFLVLTDETSGEAVQRRLRSAGRGALADSVRLEAGPIGTVDAWGSTSAVLDLGSVQAEGNAVALSVFIDRLGYEARLAAGLLGGSVG